MNQSSLTQLDIPKAIIYMAGAVYSVAVRSYPEKEDSEERNGIVSAADIQMHRLSGLLHRNHIILVTFSLL